MLRDTIIVLERGLVALDFEGEVGGQLHAAERVEERPVAWPHMFHGIPCEKLHNRLGKWGESGRYERGVWRGLSEGETG